MHKQEAYIDDIYVYFLVYGNRCNWLVFKGLRFQHLNFILYMCILSKKMLLNVIKTKYKLCNVTFTLPVVSRFYASMFLLFMSNKIIYT